MPKKKDGEGKKRRTSSAKDARSVTSPNSGELLLPPTPSASHLVASNPFDDPPSNSMGKPGGAMGLSGHMMVSPPPMAMNSNGSSPTWGPSHLAASHRARAFGSPGGPGWNPNPGEMLPQVYQGHPLQHSPSMSPQGYGYVRSPMVRPGSAPHQLPYGGPPRMPVNRFGEPIVQMNGERMPMPQHSPSHFLPSNFPSIPNQVLARMPVAPNQNPVRQLMPSTKRTAARSESKNSRSDSSSTTPKAKRKTKASDAKSYSRTNSGNECEEKNMKLGLSRTTGKLLPSPSGSRTTPPHAVPPMLPHTCTQCCQDIKYPSEDTICCLASCNTWYHRTCAGLTEAAYNCLRSEELALWACDNCLRTKEINSIRLRETARTDLACGNVDGNVPITGKA